MNKTTYYKVFSAVRRVARDMPNVRPMHAHPEHGMRIVKMAPSPSINSCNKGTDKGEWIVSQYRWDTAQARNAWWHAFFTDAQTSRRVGGKRSAALSLEACRGERRA